MCWKEAVEVVGRVIKMRPPVEAQPLDRGLDRILVLDILLDRIGVVEAQMADAAVLARQAEIQANRLGVPDVQIAVGLGREASDHSPAVFPASVILRDDLSKKIGGGRGRVLSQCSSHCALFMNKLQTSYILTGAHALVIDAIPRGIGPCGEGRAQQGFAGGGPRAGRSVFHNICG